MVAVSYEVIANITSVARSGYKYLGTPYASLWRAPGTSTRARPVYHIFCGSHALLACVTTIVIL